MQADFIFVAEGSGDAALRKLCVGIGDLSFRKHQHPARGSKLNGCTQSCDARAYDEKISFRRCGWHWGWYHFALLFTLCLGRLPSRPSTALGSNIISTFLLRSS